MSAVASRQGANGSPSARGAALRASVDGLPRACACARLRHLSALVLVVLTGCATPPPMVQPDEEEEAIVVPAPPAPMVEYPPIEPVEPPEATPEPAPPPTAPPSTESTPTPTTTLAPAPAMVAPPEIPAETLELLALLSDLQRYGTLSAEDVRRELAAATQQLNRQRTDANRVRLAVLYTLARSSPQDDQRALQLLDNVAKSNPGSPEVKQVALVLHVQISERVRAVRDEQQKGDAAIQKLEALRAMERSLLRDRVRSGGGGGGASGGAGSSGGGSGGGGGSGSGGR
jgi:hypothetical protein